MQQTVFERQTPARATVDHALAGTEHSVFWIDDLDSPARYPALTGTIDADLVIVGGGFCGLWTAVRAKERDPGRSVVLVEARRIGWAASGRNGGFAEASLTHGDENGRSRWPEEMAQLQRLGLENLQGIVDTIERYGMDCDLTQPGLLQVAVEDYQVEALRQGASAHTPLLGRAETRALVNSPIYLGALRHDGGLALVHPAKLASELARVASELGVRIFENSPVVSLNRETAGASARAAGGARVRARKIALATNVFPSLLTRTRLHTVPVYDYVLATEPLSSAQLADIGWEGREGISDTANQFHYYRMTADDRIVWGGYDAIYHYGRAVRSKYEDRPSSYRTLAGHFFTTFPQLDGVRFTHRWAGAIDTCTRFCAYFGTAYGDAVAYAAGFTGLGVAATRFAADVMLDRLDGEKSERTELEMVRRMPLPFPPEPLAAIGINLTRWSLDRADHNSGRRNILLKTLDALGLGFDS